MPNSVILTVKNDQLKSLFYKAGCQLLSSGQHIFKQRVERWIAGDNSLEVSRHTYTEIVGFVQILITSQS